jgi:hypothetical protein
LQSAFTHSAFSPNTFDGGVRRGDVPASRTMGHHSIIGAVRVAQMRSDSAVCDHVSTQFKTSAGHHFQCYGDTVGQWDVGTESTASYGTFAPPPTTNALDNSNGNTTAFLYDGIYAKTGLAVPAGLVKKERALPHSGLTMTNKLHTEYLSPTHAVLFDPRDGHTLNAEAVVRLVQSNFVDLHTRGTCHHDGAPPPLSKPLTTPPCTTRCST